MGSKVKTINVTKNEIQEMINSARKMQDTLRNNNTEKEAIEMNFASIATGILGLIFWQYRLTSITMGILSVLTGSGAISRGDAVVAAKDGEFYLLRIKNTMENLGAATANIDVTYTLLSLENDLRCVSDATTNYMKTASGVIIGG